MSKSMNHCEHFKEILIADGREGVEQHAILAAHVEDCSECQQLLQAWGRIPELLEQLPEHEPAKELLQAVSDGAVAPGQKSKSGNRRRFLAPSLASAAVLLAAFGLSRELLMHESPKVPYSIERQRVAGQTARGPDVETVSGRFEDASREGKEQTTTGKPGLLEQSRLEGVFDRVGDDVMALDAPQRVGDDEIESREDRGAYKSRDFKKPESSTEEGQSQLVNSYGFAQGEASSPDTEETEIPEDTAPSNFEFKGKAKTAKLPASRPVTTESEEQGRFYNTPALKSPNETPSEVFRSSLVGGKVGVADRDSMSGKRPDKNINQIIVSSNKNDIQLQKDTDKYNNQITSRDNAEIALNGKLASSEITLRGAEIAQAEIQHKQKAEAATKSAVAAGAGGYAHMESNQKIQNGFDFLGHYQQTANLQTQPATGYWANTYIPGDPTVRLLSARLAQWDRSWLPEVQLEQDVEPVQQPFDTPADNALALSLMTDTNGVFVNNDASEQRLTRMRLQVGVRGIEHRRGQRPAMNVGVVVDLPLDATDEVRIATRALLDAMLQSKQSGDRFSLVITGQPGEGRGLVVAPGDFRFGSLQLAKQIILDEDIAISEQEVTDSSHLDLYSAIQRSRHLVRENDDPSQPLGSSSIVLIGAKAFENTQQLNALAHANAKEGTTLSVFPLGHHVQGEQVEQLVLAGLGNRRFLETPSQARQLVEEELHASSRAVARAARLSIRLAPGVELIGVVGSEFLDTQRAERVREIETSMDRRLSANQGIQADRGEDEEGIQIVIPSIFSGDSLTVLVDIVTDRPGAIADVSLRYKDLVFLRNGNLQGHMGLPAVQSAATDSNRGPAELAVLKNLLSHHFVMAMDEAATALGRQQADRAADILRAMHATLEQARQKIPAWTNDPDLIHDQQVLDRYIAALASPQAGTHQSFLTDSLQYAAWAKTHRKLEEWK